MTTPVANGQKITVPGASPSLQGPASRTAVKTPPKPQSRPQAKETNGRMMRDSVRTGMKEGGPLGAVGGIIMGAGKVIGKALGTGIERPASRNGFGLFGIVGAIAEGFLGGAGAVLTGVGAIGKNTIYEAKNIPLIHKESKEEGPKTMHNEAPRAVEKKEEEEKKKVETAKDEEPDLMEDLEKNVDVTENTAGKMPAKEKANDEKA